jgi:histidyl-tRNA synthetase
VFVVDTTGGLHAAEVCNLLRNNAISADRAFDNRSMKAQMKAADRSGAAIALIIGTDEVAAGHIIVRPMNSGEQYAIAQDQLVAAIRNELQK